MIDKKQFLDILENTNLNPWKTEIFKNIQSGFSYTKHSDLIYWKSILNILPKINPSIINLKTSTIQIGTNTDIKPDLKLKLELLLKKFCPWRKGPFNIFGIFIDTEWRSDWKWDRLKDHIQPLKDRIILDVGCGSGYYAFRMIGEEAKLILGLEPYLLNVFQFFIINQYVKNKLIQVLPLGIEKFQYASQAFDTLFSMGVLYHRRSPFDHLIELRNHLHSEGELVLETLVINGKKGEVLVPEDRYAKMGNVWFIPSCLTLESWLERSRFKNIRLIDVTKTTIEEQRTTEWMQYESLSDFLNPTSSDKTIEGLPAPKRAIFLAEGP